MRTHVRHRLAGALAVVAVAGTLLAGCSPADEANGAARAAPAPQADQDYQERPTGDVSQPAQRQVIQTGRVTLTAKDPVAVVPKVVSLVGAQGPEARVDSREETSGNEHRGGSATLTVRIPSNRLNATIDELKKLGKVVSLEINAEDVTDTASDLDARIAAQEISVERMTAVLAGAQTTADVIAAEEALSQRQSDLESMVAQRNRIADQVALSTFTIYITTPDGVPAEKDDSFGGALSRGWSSLTGAAKAVGLGLTEALPWLAVLALLATAVILPLRRRMRRRRATTTTTPATPPTSPV
ncbi:MAG: DUF4349 domain-containing protein [Micrococcales bacterium]|nr:DUF4349 domain-containing protein [Micrococcales bacterium]